MKVKHLLQNFQMKVWTISLTIFISTVFLIVFTISVPSPMKTRLSISRFRLLDDGAKIFQHKTKIQWNNTLLRHYILRKHLYPPSPKPYKLEPLSILPTSLRPQVDTLKYEKRIIEQLGIVDGFFVEYRALDGVVLSHTLSLELQKYSNWTGLLIEPSPDLFSHLRRRNRLAWIANVCITSAQPDEYLIRKSIRMNPWRSDNKYDKLTEMSHFYSLELLQLENLDSPSENKKDRKISEKHEYTRLECFPLHSILWAMRISRVDLLVLHVENQLSILKNFPFKGIHIKVIVVTNVIKDVARPLHIFLQGKGYGLVFQSSNDYIFTDTIL